MTNLACQDKISHMRSKKIDFTYTSLEVLHESLAVETTQNEAQIKSKKTAKSVVQKTKAVKNWRANLEITLKSPLRIGIVIEKWGTKYDQWTYSHHFDGSESMQTYQDTLFGEALLDIYRQIQTARFGQAVLAHAEVVSYDNPSVAYGLPESWIEQWGKSALDTPNDLPSKAKNTSKVFTPPLVVCDHTSFS